MKVTNQILPLLTIAINGVFIGGQLLISVLLGPFWKKMEPQAVLDWFTQNVDNMGLLMAPLGPLVLILSVIVFFKKGPSKLLWGLTVIFMLGNILYLPFYFIDANTMLVDQVIQLDMVKTELLRWLNFNWQRTFFALAALTTSIWAVSKTR